MGILFALLLVMSGLAALLGLLLLRTQKSLERLQVSLNIKKELDEVNRTRAAADGFYDNVLEADITNDRLLGRNCAELIAQLDLPPETPFSRCIEEIILRLVKEEHREIYRKNFDCESLLQRFEAGEQKFTFEFEECADLKNYYWTRVTVCIYYSEASRAVKIISYVKNIQAEKEKELHLLQEANTDYLTGLYNKRAAEAMIDPLLAQQGGATGHALMILDVDYFKQVNDALGHAGGDEVLRQIAQLLREQMNERDIISRIGGDEFLVLLRDCATKQEATERVERFREALATLVMPQYPDTSITTSIGLALYPGDADHYVDLFNMADQALYVVKRKDRNDFRFFCDKP